MSTCYFHITSYFILPLSFADYQSEAPVTFDRFLLFLFKKHCVWPLRPKYEVVLFPETGRVKIFSLLTRPHSRMCIRIYIFFQTKKQKAKETKGDRKIERNQKKKRRKKMLLLLTISVENLTGYNDVVWKFALCTFNLPDHPTKRERVLKNNKWLQKVGSGWAPSSRAPP